MKKLYTVKFEETNSRYVDVLAESESEANEIAEEYMQNGDNDYILDDDEYFEKWELENTEEITKEDLKTIALEKYMKLAKE